MKITRRPPPVDFGASNDDRLAAAPEALVGEALGLEAQASAAPAAPAAAEPTAVAPVATQPRLPAPRPREPAGWPIYLVAFAVAVLWAVGPIAFAVGYRS